MKILTILLLLFCFAADSGFAQSYEGKSAKSASENKNSILPKRINFTAGNSGGGRFDAGYYKIELTIDFDNRKIYGAVTALVTALEDSLERLTLNLDQSMTVKKTGGDALSFTRSGQNLNLTLKRKYSVGEKITVTAEYEGVPVDNGYFRFYLMPQENTPMAATLSEPYGAPYWWPCKDSPADKADSLDILITVPAGYWAGSNGLLVSRTINGDGTSTFHWHEGYPIATYLVSLAAGKYHHFTDYYHYGADDSLLLDYYVYPHKADAAHSVFSQVPDYLDALRSYFGEYPFLKEKYGMAQFNWSGGMENQTLTSIGFVTPLWKFVYVHELAHHWFGDKLTCASWREIWLNEGFATYSEALYAEWGGYGGFPPGKDAYHCYMGTQKYFEGGTIIREDTLDVGSLFSRIVYEKASWVLHMLRHITGEDTFFDILKTYLNDPRWAYGSVKTENFMEICEQKTGLNLTKFFDQWLNYPYYPRYEFGWKVEQNGDSYSVEALILQTQSTIIYEMPIDLTFRFVSAPDTTITVFNNSKRAVYNFTFPQKPQQVLFDGDDWILKSLNEIPYGRDENGLEIETLYPMPFSKVLNIRVFNWSQDRHRLDIYDSMGRKVRTIRRYRQEHNFYYISTWDGKNDNGNPVSSGIYFIRPYREHHGADKFGKPKKVIYLK
jgi:aminopeptidase N